MAKKRFFELDIESKKELLLLARTAIRDFLSTGRKQSYGSNNPKLKTHAGAFVSLHSGPSLRGCIGFITSERPLQETIADAAVSAATGDPRFPKVSLDELKELEIEISILSQPEEIKDIEEIEVGRDGLIITSGPYRGLLLPQVATEYGWDRETFLSHTCHKAGLPLDAWRTGVTIERFTAQVFSEGDVVT